MSEDAKQIIKIAIRGLRFIASLLEKFLKGEKL